jgi:hypothetical protein
VTNNELLSTLLVHPEIENNQACRKDYIRIVGYTNGSDDKVYLKFVDESEAVYSSNALFSLKDKDNIFAADPLENGLASLDKYNAFYKTTLLQDMDRSTDIWHALEMPREKHAMCPNSFSNIAVSLGQCQLQSGGL